MILQIQDPKHTTAPSLHESLLEACQGAISGGGAFAFASQGGVKLLIQDEVFWDFIQNGRFDLIVGVDEITNVRTLQDLNEITQTLTSLSVRVFHHSFPGAVFHPKFCWFRHEFGGFLIVGSGNLTVRGLRGNWEAFTVSRLTLDEMNELEQKWIDWTDSHSDWLKSPIDQQVLERAALNIRRITPRGTGEVVVAEETEEVSPDVDIVVSGPPQQAAAVLVAEIPRSGDRWNQANFDLDTFRNFFGAEAGTTQRILLQHVNLDGTVGNLESRPSVSVKSQNYRFELEAAAGVPYPERNRPIAVFIRVATRTFKYRLLLPDDPHYATVLAFAQQQWTGREDRMKRVVTDTNTLQQVWPDSPLW